jgi:hypothetical protein
MLNLVVTLLLIIDYINVNISLNASNFHNKWKLFGFEIFFNYFKLDRTFTDPDIDYTSLIGYETKSENGYFYGGQLVNNLANGKGLFIFLIGQFIQINHFIFFNLKYKGMKIFENGDIYEGDFINEAFSGFILVKLYLFEIKFHIIY